MVRRGMDRQGSINKVDRTDNAGGHKWTWIESNARVDLELLCRQGRRVWSSECQLSCFFGLFLDWLRRGFVAFLAVESGFCANCAVCVLLACRVRWVRLYSNIIEVVVCVSVRYWAASRMRLHLLRDYCSWGWWKRGWSEGVCETSSELFFEVDAGLTIV